MTDPSANPLPGKGLSGWLGRQVGYVRRAWRTSVGEQVVYRHEQVQEAPMPGQPGVTLRRVTRDEIILTPPRPPQRPDAPGG